MNDEKDTVTEEKDYPINVSDWLSFLESNASSNMSLYVFLSCIIIALSISSVGLTNEINLLCPLNFLSLVLTKTPDNIIRRKCTDKIVFLTSN